MLTESTNFIPAAEAELFRQIEGLSPSARALNSVGFGWQLSSHLEKLIRGDVAPDLNELRGLGVDLKTAVGIAEAVSKRHARKAAAIAVVPAAPQPPAPVERDARTDAWASASQMHELFAQLENGRAPCLTTLCQSGWSESTARELVKVANAARRAFPKVVTR